jgi:hypothetical protein
MFHMGKIQETKCFKYSAPFRPFLGKFGQNYATDLYSRLHFSRPLLSFAAEESASWEHWAGVLDEPYSQRNPLSGVAVQARQSSYIGWNRVHPMYPGGPVRAERA